MAQSEYLRLERGLRPKQPEEHPPDQVEQVLHRAFIARFGPSRQADGIYDSDRHLRRVLRAYVSYYNGVRTHWSLNKDAPVHRPTQRIGILRSHPILGGLHHQYVRI